MTKNTQNASSFVHQCLILVERKYPQIQLENMKTRSQSRDKTEHERFYFFVISTNLLKSFFSTGNENTAVKSKYKIDLFGMPCTTYCKYFCFKARKHFLTLPDDFNNN